MFFSETNSMICKALFAVFGNMLSCSFIGDIESINHVITKQYTNVSKLSEATFKGTVIKA